MSGASTSWPAPAKLNLFLHIVGRRDDGYHLLQTVFQFVDFADALRFSVVADGRITRRGRVGDVPAESDLTVRAARLLQRRGDVSQGVEIEIDKRLPLGGGLGGGSSDAATTLVALNHLWGVGLDPHELAALGLQLGADVPVFVRGQAAWAEGVGERLTPVTLDQPWYLVVVPDCEVSTADVFRDPDLTRNSTPITIRNFLSGEGRNDCEPLVRRRFPPVDEAMTWLSRFAAARMSGTGASVFAAFADKDEAYAVYNNVPRRWRAFIAKGCNESPLLQRLRAEQRV